MGVEQNSPKFTPGVANLESSEAMARSQLATSWQPAAVATPFTSAIIGLGVLIISCIKLEQDVNNSLKYFSPPSSLTRADVISFKSCPEQNTFPNAAKTITFTDLSEEARLISSIKELIIISDKAFLC